MLGQAEAEAEGRTPGAVTGMKSERLQSRAGKQERGVAGEKSGASSQARSSAHRRHCSSLVYLYSRLLPAQRMERAFTGSSSLLGSLGAQGGDTGPRSILVSPPAAHAQKPRAALLRQPQGSGKG